MQYSSRYEKQNGKLVALNNADKVKFKLFLESIPEGTKVDMFISIEKDDASLAQLAKIHAMCRTLADHIGETFEDMKLLIKQRAGLVTKTDSQVIIKSFSVCSKEELSLAIQAAKEIGELVNCLVD
jgi:hypothetical protein